MGVLNSVDRLYSEMLKPQNGTACPTWEAMQNHLFVPQKSGLSPAAFDAWADATKQRVKKKW